MKLIGFIFLILFAAVLLQPDYASADPAQLSRQLERAKRIEGGLALAAQLQKKPHLTRRDVMTLESDLDDLQSRRELTAALAAESTPAP